MNKLKYSLIGIVLFLFIGYGMGLHTTFVRAYSSVGNYFGRPDCYTAVSTSTQSYMTHGTATTTVTCGMGLSGAESATLLVVVNASSTLTQYELFVEESMNEQDWYPISFNQSASTTNPFNLDLRGSAVIRFASSTIGGTREGASSNQLGVSGTNNRNHYTFDIPVRMRLVRVYAGLASTSPLVGIENGAIWMQILPKSSY